MRERIFRMFVMSWPWDLIARVGYRLRCLQADFVWNDAEAKFNDAEAKSTPLTCRRRRNAPPTQL